MSNIFGPKLRELREKHFPGESLRKVAEKLKNKAQMGDNFYSYLSKIELSVSLPSEDFLEKITNAYTLSSKEQEELISAYFHDKVEQSVQNLKQTPAPKTVVQFLRTVKSKNDENKNP